MPDLRQRDDILTTQLNNSIRISEARRAILLHQQYLFVQSAILRQLKGKA